MRGKSLYLKAHMFMLFWQICLHCLNQCVLYGNHDFQVFFFIIICISVFNLQFLNGDVELSLLTISLLCVRIAAVWRKIERKRQQEKRKKEEKKTNPTNYYLIFRYPTCSLILFLFVFVPLLDLKSLPSKTWLLHLYATSPPPGPPLFLCIYFFCASDMHSFCLCQN